MALFIALGAVRQAICKLWWFERYNGIGHTFRLIIISQSWGIPSMRYVIGRKFLKRISFSQYIRKIIFYLNGVISWNSISLRFDVDFPKIFSLN